MRQRPHVVEDLAQVADVEVAAAVGAAQEVLGLLGGLGAYHLTNDLAADGWIMACCASDRL